MSARVAFELARKRQQPAVASVEKANVMESGLLWRQTVITALHKAEYRRCGAVAHALADNCAMQLVRNPKQYRRDRDRRICSATCCRDLASAC